MRTTVALEANFINFNGQKVPLNRQAPQIFGLQLRSAKGIVSASESLYKTQNYPTDQTLGKYTHTVRESFAG